MACATFANSNSSKCRRNQLVCAFPGLYVVKSPSFPEGEEAGRVGNGVGIVHESDYQLGNLKIYWRDDGDFTFWTRAAEHGLDVVTVCTP